MGLKQPKNAKLATRGLKAAKNPKTHTKSGVQDHTKFGVDEEGTHTKSGVSIRKNYSIKKEKEERTSNRTLRADDESFHSPNGPNAHPPYQEHFNTPPGPA